MANITADTYTVAQGVTFAQCGRGTPAALQIALGFDGANPEHLALRCPITGTVPEGTLVRVQHKTAGASTWRDGPFLRRIRLSDLGALPADLVGKVTDSFVGMAFGVAAASSAATALDVRLAVYPPASAPVQYVTGAHTLQALAPAAPAVTHNCTPSTFAATLASLPHQSGAAVHLRLAAGTYSWSNVIWNKGGTESARLYVSAAALGDVVINTPAGRCLFAAADWVVFEKLRFQGSGVDSGPDASSLWLEVSGATAKPTGWTLRNCEVLGFDVCAKAFRTVDRFHFHGLLVQGNNPWSETTGGNTWNDSAFQLPGVGNAVWNCTISGHGDVFRLHTSLGIYFSAGSGIYRCDVLRTGDDLLEADDGSGNLYAWRNRVKNCGNAISADGAYGPTYFVQNVIVNPSRGPLKLTSNSHQTVVQANTFVMSEKVTAAGLLTPNGGTQRGLELTNNIFHYTGAGNVMHWSAGLAEDVWGNNAWYPDRDFLLNTVGIWANLAAAKAGNPARFANDIVLPAQPFATAITLGASYTSEYLAVPDATLATGSPARNAGRTIPGVTDGFTGPAPDMGAIITGQAAVEYGVPSSVSWAAPAAGSMAQIGFASGAHPLGLPATISNIDPATQPWGTGTPWAGSGSRGNKPWTSSNDFGGIAWAQSTRQAVSNGGGHVAYCATAPQAWDAATLSCKWLAVPIPSDGFSQVGAITTPAGLAAVYPAAQLDSDWGEWTGDYTGIAADLRQPGKIFPEVAHNYYGMFWVPGSAHGNSNGAIVYCAGITGNGESSGIPSGHYFDLDSASYARTANRRAGATGLSAAAGGTIYHPGVGKGFAITSGPSAAVSAYDVYDPATRAWTRRNSTNAVSAGIESGGLGAFYSASVPDGLLLNFLPVNGSGIFAFSNAVAQRIDAMSATAAAAGGGTWSQLTVSAASWPRMNVVSDSLIAPGETTAAIGWCFHPGKGAFYAVNGRNGSTTLWKLSPPAGATTIAALLAGTWTITTETISGPGLLSRTSTGGANDARRVYNRLAYDAVNSCLIFFPECLTDRPTAITPA